VNIIIDICEQYFGYADLQEVYDRKYPNDLHPKTLELKNKPKKKTKHRPTKPDQLLINKFNNFYDECWISDWYSPSDFNGIFGINRHLSRYYLLNMVDEGKLFRIKYLNKTFFVKKTAVYKDVLAEDYFRGYIWIGVEISSKKFPRIVTEHDVVENIVSSEIDIDEE
jgi:hypothetical protein